MRVLGSWGYNFTSELEVVGIVIVVALVFEFQFRYRFRDVRCNNYGSEDLVISRDYR